MSFVLLAVVANMSDGIRCSPLPPIHQTGHRISGTLRHQQPQQEQYRTVWRKQFAVVATTYKRLLANAPKFVGVSD